MTVRSALPERQIDFHLIDSIELRQGRRVVNDDAVGRLAESMKEIGLKTPISVRYYMERPDYLPGESSDAIVLLTGRHRLEAARRLGWEEIECFVHYEGNEIEGELWEIAENLHRAELTALERDEQLARWIQLTNEKQGVSGQSAQKPQGGRPEGGLSAAARELGIERRDARRAVQVASLTPDAKQAARDTGLDDNRTVLLEAAKKPQEAQVHYLRTEGQKRDEQRRPPAIDATELDFQRLLKAWDGACPLARERFSAHVREHFRGTAWQSR
jgi:ParB/RepB/Spo0J family partition protein